MDVVLDTVSGNILQRAFRTLRAGGFLVTVVAVPKIENEQHGINVARATCRPSGMQLASIRRLVELGKLEPRIGMVLASSDVTHALELSENGRASGKIVLQVANS